LNAGARAICLAPREGVRRYHSGRRHRPPLINRLGATTRTDQGVQAAAAEQDLLPTPTPPPFAAHNDYENGSVHLYESARSSVVNITNRGYTTDQFMQPVPQEGTGFLYDGQPQQVDAKLAERPQQP
jgi:hypothetical protein